MVEVSYFLFPLPRRARGRPMIVERGSGRDRKRRGRSGKGWVVEERRRLLENCGHNSSRDRYYYRTRWNVSAAPRLQLCRMHLNPIHLRCVMVSKQRCSHGIAGFAKTRVYGDRLAIPHSMQSRRNHSRAPFTRFLPMNIIDIGKRWPPFSHRENFSRIRSRDSYRHCFSFLPMLHLFIIQQSENIVYSFKTSRTLRIDW